MCLCAKRLFYMGRCVLTMILFTSSFVRFSFVAVPSCGIELDLFFIYAHDIIKIVSESAKMCVRSVGACWSIGVRW